MLCREVLVSFEELLEELLAIVVTVGEDVVEAKMEVEEGIVVWTMVEITVTPAGVPVRQELAHLNEFLVAGPIYILD